MSLDDRLGYLFLGMLIGFAIGYLTKSLRETKVELDEVYKIVKRDHDRDERGFMRFPLVADIALLAVVVLTVWAAFSSQQASNDVKNTQDQLIRTQERTAVIVSCTQKYLNATIEALNQRTTYTGEQANKNVELQKAQSTFLRILIGPPPPTAQDTEVALREYFSALTEFVEVSSAQSQRVQDNPYPTEDQLNNCLHPEIEE